MLPAPCTQSAISVTNDTKSRGLSQSHQLKKLHTHYNPTVSDPSSHTPRPTRLKSKSSSSSSNKSPPLSSPPRNTRSSSSWSSLPSSSNNQALVDQLTHSSIRRSENDADIEQKYDDEDSPPRRSLRNVVPSVAPSTMNSKQRQSKAKRDRRRSVSSSSSPSHSSPHRSVSSTSSNSVQILSQSAQSSQSQSVRAAFNDAYVDIDAMSLGSGEDNDRSERDAGGIDSEAHDPSIPSIYVNPPSNVPSVSSLISDLRERNEIRSNLHSIFDESQDVPVHHSVNTCFDDLDASRNLYRFVPAGARTMFIGAFRKRWMNLSKALDAWQATGRSNHQPLYNAFMSMYKMPRDSLRRMRGKKKNKCQVLNHRFQSIMAEIHYDDVLASNPDMQNGVDEESVDSADNHHRTRSSTRPADNAAAFDKQAAIAAQTLIKDCYISRAMKRLVKKRLNNKKSFSDILHDLRNLHPQVSHSIPPLPSDSPPIFIDSENPKFIELLKEMDNGSSAGLSGMTGNMLAVLADDPDCRRYIAQFTSAVINGDLPDCIRRVLLASLLIGIPKPNNGTRPIAIGEILYRLASRYALSLINTDHLNSIFLPHQFGVKVAAGCETVIHTVQQALDDESAPYYAMCVDMKNAFNELNREEMLKSLFSHRKELSPIFRLVHWCYREPTPLITQNGQGELSFIQDLLSSEGTRQGANESSLLFALPLQPIFIRMYDKFPGLKIASFLDDVTLLHRDPVVLVEAFDWLVHEAASVLGLVVQPSKCQFIYFNHTEVDRLSKFEHSFIQSIRERATICVDGACLLGSAVGRTDDILHRLLVQQIGTTHDDMFKRLLNRDLKIQSAMLLLRQCMIPKLNYILRTVRPSATARITAQFDSQALECSFNMLEMNRTKISETFKDQLIAQLRLPCKMSGFGLRSSAMVAPFAYLDSASRAVHLDHITNQLFTASQSSSFRHAIDECISSVNEQCSPKFADVKKLIPESVNAFLHRYQRNEKDENYIHYLQKVFTHEAEKQQFRALFSTFSSSEYHSARLLATSAKGASMWKTAVPVDLHCMLTDQQYIIVTRINLGMSPCEIMPNICGQCKRPVGRDNCSTHALSCNYLKGTLATDRHDMIQSVLESYATRAGLDVQRHQRTDRFSSDKRTTDFTLLRGGVQQAWDVTCRHPTCPSAVKSAAKTQLITAARADRDKHRHHHVDVDANQSHIEPALRGTPEFRSFSCESYGGMHADAAQLIQELCILAQNHPTVFTDYEIKYGLSASIACAIQRFNAAMILENINQAAKPHAASAPSYHAPSHVVVPLSSYPPSHHTFMHRSRICPDASINSQSRDSISVISEDLFDEDVHSHSDSSIVQLLANVHDNDGNDSMNVQASSSSVRLARSLSVALSESGRTARSTFAVDNRVSVADVANVAVSVF